MHNKLTGAILLSAAGLVTALGVGLAQSIRGRNPSDRQRYRLGRILRREHDRRNSPRPAKR